MPTSMYETGHSRAMARRYFSISALARAFHTAMPFLEKDVYAEYHEGRRQPRGASRRAAPAILSSRQRHATEDDAEGDERRRAER